MDGPASAPDSPGFADLSPWRKLEVLGDDGLDWLNALVTADLSGLAPGQARRSLLLSRTGQVRADFVVTAPQGHPLLIQDPDQPTNVITLLTPYVLSSQVDLVDRTADFALFVLPGVSTPPETGGATWGPSVVGPGVDVLVGADQADEVSAILAAMLPRATAEGMERWRVEAGLPRLGIDTLPEDLPQESGLEGAVSAEKGCFLGQEAVARVRNLGHPRRVLVRVRADTPVAPGAPVLSEGEPAGIVTSAAGRDGTTVALARIAWRFRDRPLTTAEGDALRIGGIADG